MKTVNVHSFPIRLGYTQKFENVLMEPLPNDQWKIAAPPFYIPDIDYGDIVRIEDQKLYMVTSSERTRWLIDYGKKEDLDVIKNILLEIRSVVINPQEEIFSISASFDKAKNDATIRMHLDTLKQTCRFMYNRMR